MTTLVEIATRAVCREFGVDPDQWQTFAAVGTVAMAAILESLPSELREALEAFGS